MNWYKKIASNISLWLDDERDPKDPKIINLFGSNGNEIWVKTIEEAITYLKQGNVGSISFDHDLGGETNYSKTGYDLANWIEEQAFNNKIPKLSWRIHSKNPEGARNIQKAMESANKFWEKNMTKQASIKNKVLIMRGISGSGKSFLAKELQKKYNVDKTVSADHFFTDEKGMYNWSANKTHIAHKVAKQDFLNRLSKKEPVIIVDNTNTKFSEFSFYVKEAVKAGYEVEFVEPNWHPDLKDKEGRWNVDFIEKQQKNRASQNKVIPRDVLEKMRDRYEYNPTVDKLLNIKDL